MCNCGSYVPWCHESVGDLQWWHQSRTLEIESRIEVGSGAGIWKVVPRVSPLVVPSSPGDGPCVLAWKPLAGQAACGGAEVRESARVLAGTVHVRTYTKERPSDHAFLVVQSWLCLLPHS